GLLSASRPNGWLAGRLRADWSPAAEWMCLTGTVQIAHCWLLLATICAEQRYRDAAYAANAYVRRTIEVEGRAEIRGGVKGAHPINGDYGRFEYLNWAVKFMIDANLIERESRTTTNT
ncbi:MAG: prenyltransferase/squalene oxidase repeat-containing protein, partial [Gammaproteobacteria bacterium]